MLASDCVVKFTDLNIVTGSITRSSHVTEKEIGKKKLSRVWKESGEGVVQYNWDTSPVLVHTYSLTHS